MNETTLLITEEWPEQLSPGLATFVKYWRQLQDAAGDGLPPRRTQFDPSAVKRILSSIVMFDVEYGADGAPSRYRYRLAGSMHRDVLGRDVTGLYLEDVNAPQSVADSLIVYRRIVESGEPHYWRRYTGIADRQYIWFERILAPMRGAQGNRVEFLIGAWHWPILD